MGNVNNAFSLIELMVVIAIIGVLAAIAVPLYTQYAIRTQIINALKQIDPIVYGALKTYATTGAFPASVSINGVNIPASVPSTVTYLVNMSNISWVAYGRQTDSMYIQMSLTGNYISNIPGYVNGPSSPTKAVITMAWRNVNGVMKYACGSYSAAYVSQIIPTAYMPSACSCANVGSFFLSGADPTCGSSW